MFNVKLGKMVEKYKGKIKKQCFQIQNCSHLSNQDRSGLLNYLRQYFAIFKQEVIKTRGKSDRDFSNKFNHPLVDLKTNYDRFEITGLRDEVNQLVKLILDSSYF
jgi:hypothetical protein